MGKGRERKRPMAPGVRKVLKKATEAVEDTQVLAVGQNCEEAQGAENVLEGEDSEGGEGRPGPP